MDQLRTYAKVNSLNVAVFVLQTELFEKETVFGIETVLTLK